MKNQYTVKVNLSEELLRKLLYVSEKEKRTPNNQFIFTAQQGDDVENVVAHLLTYFLSIFPGLCRIRLDYISFISNCL